MSYKLESIEEISNGYYRAVFKPCANKFVVDIPTKEMIRFFFVLSELDQQKPFDVQICKKSGYMDTLRYKERYTLRLGQSDFYIEDVIPIKEVELETDENEEEEE